RVLFRSIEQYKNQFSEVNQFEIYKWKAVKQFQDNWDIDASDFCSMLVNSLKLVGNLLDSGQYFPKKMLLNNAKVAPEEVRSLFKNLFDEEYDILGRIEVFRSDFKKLNEENFKGLKGYQDHRATIVYLALRFPERYFFYKHNMFKSFSKKIDYSYKPIAGKIKNIGQFQTLCNLIRHELSIDQELLKLHKNRISDDCYYDESLTILTQDFIYAVAKHLKPLDISQNKIINEISITEVQSTEVSIKEMEVDFTPRTVNYIQNNIENKRIGDLGELWVMKREEQRLVRANRPKLAGKIKHVAKDIGDGLGYDVLSYDQDGNEIFIEVKTTRGKVNSTFFITRNELEKSKIEQQYYRLYRVYNFNEETESAELMIIHGDLSDLD